MSESVAKLEQAFSDVEGLTFSADSAGRPLLNIRHERAEAIVSLYGGHVLSYRRAGEAERLFLSDTAVFEDGKAIRGGIPVCWPWFGADPEGAGRAAHGFARTSAWQLESVEQTPEAAIVLLSLPMSEASLALWPHAFSLQLEIRVGDSLALALITRNTGDAPFTLTQALHTYFAVEDIAAVSVTGLEGVRYLDKAWGDDSVQQGAIAFTGEVDRIYLDPPAVQQIRGTGQGEVRIESGGNGSMVVWNPWIEKAAAFADMPDEAYRHFVCVETTNAAPDTVELAPGAQHVLRVAYRF